MNVAKFRMYIAAISIYWGMVVMYWSDGMKVQGNGFWLWYDFYLGYLFCMGLDVVILGFGSNCSIMVGGKEVS